MEGSYRSWDLYTTGQLVNGLQQEKKTGFISNRNGIMSFFLGRQFYRSTLYFIILSHFALAWTFRFMRPYI